MIKRILVALLGGVVAASALAVPAQALEPVYTVPATVAYTPPARLPWGDLTVASTSSKAAPVLSAAQQKTNRTAYAGAQAAGTACADMGNGILGTAVAPNPLSISWGTAAMYVNGVQVNSVMSIGTAAYPTYWNSQITAAGRTHRFGGPGAC